MLKASHVFERYGQLDMSEANNVKRANIEYGFVATDSLPRRFVLLKQTAVLEGLIATGAVGRRTAGGVDRQRLRGAGGVVEETLSRSSDARQAILRTIFAKPDSMDDALQMGSGYLLNTEALRKRIGSCLSSDQVLRAVADETERFYERQGETVKDSTSAASRLASAAPLFAQHLSAMGVWLQPVRDGSEIRRLLPTKLLPILAWISTPDRHRQIAELVLSRHKAAKNTSSEAILNVFLATAANSTALQSENLSVGPLILIKEGSQNYPDPRKYSSSVNYLYQECCRYFGRDPSDHPSALLFLTSIRLAKTGVDAFDWCDRPSARNTKNVSRVLGREITDVPQYIREWARDLRELLPLFKRKDVKTIVASLNYWLIFLFMLGEERAPSRLREVERLRDINDYGRSGGLTYVEFLRRHVVGVNDEIAYIAPSTLQQAWQLAAIRDGFTNLSNPVDARADRPGKARERRARTSRKALDQKVLEVLISENRKEAFAFARCLGRGGRAHWRTVMDTTTGRHEVVFFPLLPLLTDVIMHSGARNRQAAWLDSGEGDEMSVDIEAAAYVPNTLATATPGRRQGYIQVHEIIDAKQRRPVLGMFLNTDKVVGKAYEVPWIDADVAKAVMELRDLQVRYNPISQPIPALRPATTNKYITAQVSDVYPLFREPRSPLAQPVTEAQLAQYWISLLEHCQPLVNAKLGYEYPLIRDGNPIFDIHSLRVTTVTVLIENGVSPEIVQMLVGHRSVLMTFYYNAVRDASVHRSIQDAMDRRRQAAGALDEETSDDLIREAIESHVTLRVGDDFAGADLLRLHLERRSGFDLFTHGICPGGDCSTGGERLAEGRYSPVWRPRACSGCRYRVTGPSFLAGLVHRLNSLMMEIKLSMQREERLVDEACEAEDAGHPAASLHANAAREREDRDELWREWCLEYQTVKVAEAELHAHSTDGKTLVATSTIDKGSLRLATDEVHTFEHMQALVADAKLLAGATLDLPQGLVEMRDRLLFEVVRTQEIDRYFYRLDPAARARALDRLGDLLVTHAPSPDHLQAVIDGTVRLDEIPTLADAVATLTCETPDFQLESAR